MSVDPSPRWTLAPVGALVLALLIWGGFGLYHAARAAHVTVGWRLEITACRAGTCAPLKVSDRIWAGRYACQARAETLAAFAPPALLVRAGLHREATLQARCVAVLGDRVA